MEWAKKLSPPGVDSSDNWSMASYCNYWLAISFKGLESALINLTLSAILYFPSFWPIDQTDFATDTEVLAQKYHQVIEDIAMAA